MVMLEEEGENKGTWFGDFLSKTNVHKLKHVYENEVAPMLYQVIYYRLSSTDLSVDSQRLKERIINTILHREGVLKSTLEGITHVPQPSSELNPPLPLEVNSIFEKVLPVLNNESGLLEGLITEMRGVTDTLSNPFTFITIKNKRRSLEDQVCVVTDLLQLNAHENPPNTTVTCCGVFDGHCGPDAAHYLAWNLPWRLEENVSRGFSENSGSADVETLLTHAITSSIHQLQQEFIDRRPHCSSGSTLTVVLKCDDYLVSAHVGDSAAYLILIDGGVVELTPNLHDLQNEVEREAVVQRGAHVALHSSGIYRLNGEFALSRSFGDRRHRNLISCEPDIDVRRITGNEAFVVIATDGFWEGVDVTELASSLAGARDTTSSSSMERVRSVLIDFIKEAKITVSDNITVLVFTLEK